MASLLSSPAVPLAALLVLLLLGMLVNNSPRRESFFIGDAECEQVPIHLSPRDSPEDKENACRSACNRRPGFKTLARSNYLTGKDNSVVACRCCDPATEVSLSAKLPGSAECIPNVTYGFADPKSRTMVAVRGCKGMFKWADNTLVKCESQGAKHVAQCPYFDPSIPTVDVEQAIQARSTFLANTLAAERKAKEDVRLEKLRQELRIITRSLPKPRGWVDVSLNSTAFKRQQLPDGSVWENPATVDGGSDVGKTQIRFAKTTTGMWTMETVMWQGVKVVSGATGTPIRSVEWNKYVDDYGASYFFPDGFAVGSKVQARLVPGNAEQAWTRIA